MNAVDLHVHSNKSDGSFTPAALVDYALEKGLSAFALTDHDTTDGIDEALLAARGKPIEVIPGIEFSTEYKGKDIHIVGLYMDYKSDYFKRRLVNFVRGRTIRNQEMCRRLTEHGFPVTYEELMAEFPDCVITRAHYARFMQSRGYVKTVKEAFDKYIGDGCPCFIPRKKITPMRAVEIILKAGGFPILAHPLLYHFSKKELDELVSLLKEMGLQGIEALYSTHTPADEREIRALAAKYGLCISGGSDFHGVAKPGLDLGKGYGKLFIPQEVLTHIQDRHRWMRSHPEQLRHTKILFTDLDGTLLNSDKQIGSYTREVLRAWTAAGHKLVLCSGRDINSVTDVKNYLGLDLPGMYLIGYNGGQIYDCTARKTLFKTTLTIPQTLHIIGEAEKAGVHVHTYSDTHIIACREDEELHYYKHAISTPVLLCPELAMGDALAMDDDGKTDSEANHKAGGKANGKTNSKASTRDSLVPVLGEGPCKCIGIELKDAEKLERFRLSLLPWAEKEKISMIYSSPIYLEFFPSASGKGAALKTLCKLLGIHPYFSVAAGDAQNDLSMIEASGMGIAMSNAAEAVRFAATTITPYDNDHDGLAHALVDLI